MIRLLTGLRTRPVTRGVLVGLLAAGVTAASVVAVPGHQQARADTPGAVAGSAGTNTALPNTPSAVTVHGHGYYANLTVTVNQTQNLVNQAISVAWSGCTAAAPYTTGCGPTFTNLNGSFNGYFSGNYLQVMECWSDPGASEPDPSQCQFGGESSTPLNSYPIQYIGDVYSRIMSQPGWGTYGKIGGWTDPNTNFEIEPFHAVDGTVVDEQADYNFVADNTNFWQNPYFSFNTTNELDFGRTYGDGTGVEPFQVDTGLEAPGLGCGQNIEPQANGSPVTPKCWLVIVPRGTPATDNPTGVNDFQVYNSPFDPTVWANRMVVPLGFTPIGSSCPLGADERRIVGSEMAAPAVTNWQPTLCSQPNSPPYNYSYLSDSQARVQLLSGEASGGPGMAVMSNPVPAAQVDPTNPIVYAPLTLSGLTVGFNIERIPALGPNGPIPGEVPLAGQRIANLNLTPRLMAKLLTESYSGQFRTLNPAKPPAGYGWVTPNPVSMVNDPDFLQYNPEFALLRTTSFIDAGDVVLEQPSSDAAQMLWKWILADPAAKAWLDGAPDPWGMKVNPIYSTSTSLNTTGAAFASSGPPDNFPKSDPYCQDVTGIKVGVPPTQVRPLCFLDWSPYALNMQFVAAAVRAANDLGTTTPNPNGTADTYWASNGPQKPGTYFVLGLTDTASAARYGLQTAALSRAGDDGSAPEFVLPTNNSILAGEGAMANSGVSGVLQPNPASPQSGVYPLSLLTYAAAQPAPMAQSERNDYAAFIDYAVGPGQVQGTAPGQLPPGLVPLPANLVTQAQQQAASIRRGGPVVPATVAPTPSTTIAPASAAATSPAGGSDLSGSGGAVAPSASSDGGAATTPGASGPGSSPSSPSTPAPGAASGATAASTSPAVGPHAAKVALTSAVKPGGIRWAVPLILLVGVVCGVVAAFPYSKLRRRA